MTSFHVYRYGSYAIASRLQFPELRKSRVQESLLVFEMRRVMPRRKRTHVRDWTTDDGRAHASLYRTADGYVIHFKRLAWFHISKDLALVSCTRCRSCTVRLMRHLFLDLVMPHVLSLAGQHVLHASAVEHEGRAVAFAGDTGAGKSTLAAALGRDSGRILADDAVVLDQREDRFLVSAPYPSLRLWGDSAATLELGRGQRGHRSGKRRFPNGSRMSFAAGSSRLDAICLLSRSSAAGRTLFTRLRAVDALVSLVHHAFKFDVSEKSFLEREFRLFSRLVAVVPCYRLTIPDSLKDLPSLTTHVSDAIQGGRTHRIV